MLIEKGAGRLPRNPKVVHRGYGNDAWTPPGWAGYATLMDTDPLGVLNRIPVLESDGATFRYWWYIGQTLALNGGCGGADTIYLGGARDDRIEIWATPAETEGRQEAYQDSVRSR